LQGSLQFVKLPCKGSAYLPALVASQQGGRPY